MKMCCLCHPETLYFKEQDHAKNGQIPSYDSKFFPFALWKHTFFNLHNDFNFPLEPKVSLKLMKMLQVWESDHPLHSI